MSHFEPGGYTCFRRPSNSNMLNHLARDRYYSMLSGSFTCDYNTTTTGGEDDGDDGEANGDIMRAGNQSYCCTVTFSKTSQVWQEVRVAEGEESDCGGVGGVVAGLLPHRKEEPTPEQHHLRM